MKGKSPDVCVKMNLALRWFGDVRNVIWKSKLLFLATIGDKIVETLSLNRVLRRTKQSQCTPPLSPRFPSIPCFSQVARTQPRSQSSSAISDVTSPVKLVGKIRARFQASAGHSDSANRPGYEAGSYRGISSPSGGGWGKVSFNLFKGGKLLQRLFKQKRLKLRFVADYSFYIIEVQRCSN